MLMRLEDIYTTNTMYAFVALALLFGVLTTAFWPMGGVWLIGVALLAGIAAITRGIIEGFGL